MRNLLILFFYVYTFSLFSQDKSNDRTYLRFENYKEKEFPKEELQELSGEELHFFSNDTIGQNILFPGECLSSNDSLYKYLINENVISGYVDINEREQIPKAEYHMDKKEYEKWLSSSLKMYFLGKVEGLGLFDSYLFTAYHNSGRGKKKNFFMVNVQDRFLTSIVVLSYVSIQEIGYKRYTLYLGNRHFRHQVRLLYSDVIGEKERQEEEPVDFYIDQNGLIVLD